MTLFRINADGADGEIRRATFNDAEHVVAPAVAARAMELNGGYVPQSEWTKSAPAWNGTPVTLSHPTDDDGRPVLANMPDVAEQSWLGRFFNVQAANDGETLEGDVWLNVDRASELGDDAQSVVDNVEAGEPVDVSTAYFADRLESGEYDGEQREAVVGNLRPEHLAVLPNDEGKCSVEDGCGVPTPPSANAADITAVDPGETVVVTDGGEPFQADDADTTADGGDSSAEAEDLDGNSGTDDEGDSTDSPEADGADRDVEPDENAIRRAYNALASVMGGEGSPPGQDSEPIANDAGGTSGVDSLNDMSDNDTMIDALVENHGYDRDVAEEIPDEALATTYEQLTNDDGDCGCGGATTNDGGDDADADGDDNDTPTDPQFNAEELADELADQFVTQDALEDALDSITERQKRQSKIDDIVANSDDYDAETLAETPEEVLGNIHEDVMSNTASTTFAARPGAAANGGGDGDLDKWEALVNKASGNGDEGGD